MGADGEDAVLLAGAEAGLDAATIDRLLLAMENHPVSALAIGAVRDRPHRRPDLLGVALRRARAVPMWVAVATAVSQPVHDRGQPPNRG